MVVEIKFTSVWSWLLVENNISSASIRWQRGQPETCIALCWINYMSLPVQGLHACRELQRLQQAVPATDLVSVSYCHFWWLPGGEGTQICTHYTCRSTYWKEAFPGCLASIIKSETITLGGVAQSLAGVESSGSHACRFFSSNTLYSRFLTVHMCTSFQTCSSTRPP